ncbi:hypothetical protein Tco_0210379 [Tanacetum coccineum]
MANHISFRCDKHQQWNNISSTIPVKSKKFASYSERKCSFFSGVKFYTVSIVVVVELHGKHFRCSNSLIYDMSNSDELRHTDNTTLVLPRLPETLLQVYHRRRPTLRLLILPSVPSFSLTIRRTARISVLPIEPNLGERAIISAINLDDYQLDPDSVPVPETVLTVCTTRLRGQLHTILEDMDRYPNSCLEELEAFMTLWDVKPRVEESSLETLSVDELVTQLRQVCKDAEDRASNAQEKAR